MVSQSVNNPPGAGCDVTTMATVVLPDGKSLPFDIVGEGELAHPVYLMNEVLNPDLLRIKKKTRLISGSLLFWFLFVRYCLVQTTFSFFDDQILFSFYIPITIVHV